MEAKFFKCRISELVALRLIEKPIPLMCCGEWMIEPENNDPRFDAKKHLPVVTRLDDCRLRIEVGEAPHPMLPEHHIDFIYVATEHGGRFVYLTDKPSTEICCGDDRPIAVYAYCNLHGMWKTDL